MLPQWRQRVKELDGHFSANGISTALCLAGLVTSDLPGIDPCQAYDYLTRLMQVRIPEAGDLIAWQRKLSSGKIYVPHIVILADINPWRVLHRPGYGYHISMKDKWDLVNRQYADFNPAFYRPPKAA